MSVRRRLGGCRLLREASRELLILHAAIFEGKNGREWESILNPVISKSLVRRSFIQQM
jgi:hypothetical protein